MSIETITILVTLLCPKLSATSDKFVIQNSKVSCMEYYTNDIVNNPNKYEGMLKHVKER